MRIVFLELWPYLDEAYFAPRDEPSEFVVTKIRDAESNLRTTFHKIVEQAGLEPWPKLLQNLRASRRTELEATFTTRVVCKRMGNSLKVVQPHYLEVTESHFDMVVQNPV